MIRWFLLLLLSGCVCGEPAKPDAGFDGGLDAGIDGGPRDAGCVDRSPCARDAGAGVCSAGRCVECSLDLDCTDRELCTIDRCVNDACSHGVGHDGDGGFLSVPEISAERRLGTGPATPIAATWTGADFLVAYQQAGFDITELKRLSLDGGEVDAFLLPSSMKLLASNGARLLAVFETMAEGVSAQLLTPSGAAIGGWALEGIATSQPRAAGVAASPDGFMVNWDYYDGQANSVALIGNDGGVSLGPPLKPGLTAYSHAGRGAWSGSSFVLAWEDQQERPANPEIWVATITAQAVPMPSQGAPALRSDLAGVTAYYSPELLNVGGRLMVVANRNGQELEAAALDSTLSAVTPTVRIPAAALLLGSAIRPLATQDGAHLLLVVPTGAPVSGGLQRISNGNLMLDSSPVVFAASTANDRVRLGSAVLATDGAGHVLVSYVRADATGAATGAYARFIHTCP